MQKMMQILIFSLVFLPIPTFGQDPPNLEMNIVQTLSLEERPVDIAISLNGKRVFALTDTGHLLIYAPNGRLEAKVPMAAGTDILQATPREDVILVGNSREKSLKVITLDFIQTIDTRGLPARGPADAPLELVVFSDFECPSCAELAVILDQIIIDHPGKIREVFMNYPLRSHPNSWAAATAALAAGRQGRFWEFHDALFENYNQLSPRKINDIARDLKLDVTRLNLEMNHPEVTAALKRDMAEAARLSIGGTPTVFVNGRILRDHSLESLQALVAGQAAGTAKK